MTFKIGDRVINRDGYIGTVRGITEHEGSHWYDVRFAYGREAVRYESDLRHANTGIGLTDGQTGGEQ